MDVAFVQHAEHDVDGDDRGEDQPQLVRQAAGEGVRRAEEGQADGRRQADCARGILHRLHRRPQADAGRGVEADGRGRILRDVGDRQRHAPRHDAGDRRQRHRLAGRRLQLEAAQSLHAVELPGHRLEDDAVLVRLGEDGRDNALAEGVVQRVVDRAGGDAEPRGGVAVDVDIGRQAVALDVVDHRAQVTIGAHFRGEFLRPGRHVGRGRAGQAGTVGRRPGFGVDRQVLHRLEPHRRAGDGGGTLAQPVDHRRQAAVALALGLEVDQQPSLVRRRVDAVDAEIGRQADDRRVAVERGGDLVLQRRGAVVGDRLRGADDRLHLARILHREQPLGDGDVQDRRQRDRGAEDDQGQPAVVEHPGQRLVVAAVDPVEHTLRRAGEARIAAVAFQQPRRHHRHQRQGDDRRDDDSDGERDGELAEQPADDVAHEQ